MIKKSQVRREVSERHRILTSSAFCVAVCVGLSIAIRTVPVSGSSWRQKKRLTPQEGKNTLIIVLQIPFSKIVTGIYIINTTTSKKSSFYTKTVYINVFYFIKC